MFHSYMYNIDQRESSITNNNRQNFERQGSNKVRKEEEWGERAMSRGDPIIFHLFIDLIGLDDKDDRDESNARSNYALSWLERARQLFQPN